MFSMLDRLEPTTSPCLLMSVARLKGVTWKCTEIDPFAIAPERRVMKNALEKAARACDLSMVVDRRSLAEVRIGQRTEIDNAQLAGEGRRTGAPWSLSEESM